MTDLTTQQLVDVILRGMKEVGERFAAQRDVPDATTSPDATSERAALSPTAQASERQPKQ